MYVFLVYGCYGEDFSAELMDGEDPLVLGLCIYCFKLQNKILVGSIEVMG